MYKIKKKINKKESIEYFKPLYFRPTEFDPNETNAFIITSSGTSGPPKGVCLTHKHLSLVIQIPWQ